MKPHDELRPFARWLDATMRAHGLTQAETARRLGVQDVQVSRWRHAQVRPSIGHLQRIANLFGEDRAKLEALAGYIEPRGEPLATELDPEAAAELDAQMARLRRILARVPRPFWPTYFVAMETLAESLDDVLGQSQRRVAALAEQERETESEAGDTTSKEGR